MGVIEALSCTYGKTGKGVDGIRSIGEVIREKGVGSGGEVGGLWVGEEVVEGVDDVLNVTNKSISIILA